MTLTPNFRHFLCLAIITTLRLRQSSSQSWPISPHGSLNDDFIAQPHTDTDTRDVQVENSGLVRHAAGEGNRGTDAGVYTLDSRGSQIRGIYKISRRRPGVADEITERSWSGSGQGRPSWERAGGGRGLADLWVSSQEELLALAEEMNWLLEAALADALEQKTPDEAAPSPYNRGGDRKGNDPLAHRQTYVIPVRLPLNPPDHTLPTTPRLPATPITRRSQDLERSRPRSPSPQRSQQIHSDLADQEYIRFLVQGSDDVGHDPSITFKPDAKPVGPVARGVEGEGGIKRARDPFIVLGELRIPRQNRNFNQGTGQGRWQDQSRKQNVPEAGRNQGKRRQPILYSGTSQGKDTDPFLKLDQNQESRSYPVPAKGINASERKLPEPPALPLPSFGSNSYPLVSGGENRLKSLFPSSKQEYKIFYPFVNRFGNQETRSISLINQGMNDQGVKERITETIPGHWKKAINKQGKSKTLNGTSRPAYSALQLKGNAGINSDHSASIDIKSKTIALLNRNAENNSDRDTQRRRNRILTKQLAQASENTLDYESLSPSNQTLPTIPASVNLYQEPQSSGGRYQRRPQHQDILSSGELETSSPHQNTSEPSPNWNRGSVSSARFPTQNTDHEGSPSQPIAAHESPALKTSPSNVVTENTTRKRRSAHTPDHLNHDTSRDANPLPPSRSNSRNRSRPAPALNTQRNPALSHASDVRRTRRLNNATSDLEHSPDSKQSPNTKSPHSNEYHGRDPNFHPPVKTRYKSPSPPTSRRNPDVFATIPPERANRSSQFPKPPENGGRQSNDRNQDGRHVHGVNPDFKPTNTEAPPTGRSQQTRGNPSNKNNGAKARSEPVQNRRSQSSRRTGAESQRRRQRLRGRQRQGGSHPGNPFLRHRSLRRKRDTVDYTRSLFDSGSTPAQARLRLRPSTRESPENPERDLEKTSYTGKDNSQVWAKLRTASGSQRSPFAPFRKNQERVSEQHAGRPRHVSARDASLPQHQETHSDATALGTISTATTWPKSFPRSPYSAPNEPDDEGEATKYGSRQSVYSGGSGYRRSAGNPYRPIITYEPGAGHESVYGTVGNGEGGGSRRVHSGADYSSGQRRSRYEAPTTDRRSSSPRSYPPDRGVGSRNVSVRRRKPPSDGYGHRSRGGVLLHNTPTTRQQTAGSGYYSPNRGKMLYNARTSIGRTLSDGYYSRGLGKSFYNYPITANDVTAYLQVYNDDNPTKGSTSHGLIGSNSNDNTGSYLLYDPTTEQLSLVPGVSAQGDHLQGAYFQYNPQTEELKLVTKDEQLVNDVDGSAAAATTTTTTTTTTSTTANNFRTNKVNNRNNLINNGPHFQGNPVSAQGVGVNVGGDRAASPTISTLSHSSYVRYNPYTQGLNLKAGDGANSVVINANDNGRVPVGPYFRLDPSAEDLILKANRGRGLGYGYRLPGVQSADRGGLSASPFHPPPRSDLVGIFRAEEQALANRPSFIPRATDDNGSGYFQLDPTSTNSRARSRSFPGSNGKDRAATSNVDSIQQTSGYAVGGTGGYIQFDPTSGGTGSPWGGGRSYRPPVPRRSYPTSPRPLVRPGPDLFLRIFRDGGVSFDGHTIIQNYYTDGDYGRMLRHFRALPLESVQSRDGVKTGTMAEYLVTACRACGPENRPMIEFVTSNPTSEPIVRRFHYRQTRQGDSSNWPSSRILPTSPYVVRPETEQRSLYLGTYPYENRPTFGVPTFRDNAFDDGAVKRQKN